MQGTASLYELFMLVTGTHLQIFSGTRKTLFAADSLLTLENQYMFNPNSA